MDNELSSSVLFGFDSLPISAEYFYKAENSSENLNLKATGENIVFNEKYEGIKKIIVRDLRDKDMNPYTEFVYWNNTGEFREILTGYFSNAAWIYFQAGSHIFWIEREEGKNLPGTLYLPRDGRLIKINFFERRSGFMSKKDANIKPLFDNVLIKPLEAETKTASGILLPDTAKEKPQTGLVMAIGDGKILPKGEKQPMVIKVGQKVMYKKWGGNEIKVGSEEWILVGQEDILAIIS